MSAPEEELADYAEEEYEEYEEGAEYEEGVDAAAIEDDLQRVAEIEAELGELTKLQSSVDKQINAASDSIDEKSIYVGQVDYEATIDELRAHFAPCGTVSRISIILDPRTGQPKGFAYVEFAEKESVENALKLDDTTFKGRQIKVLPKRHNVPVYMLKRGRGRGGPGGFRGRGGGRFARGGGGGRFSRGRGRGGGRGFRGRGAGYHTSYY